MGALKILDFKPCLTSESIKKIVDEAVSRLDVYNQDITCEEIECENGFMVEIHANNVGMNYRRLRVSYLEVHLYDKSTESYTNDEDCESYANVISDMLNEKLSELNDKEEEEFETESKYAY